MIGEYTVNHLMKNFEPRVQTRSLLWFDEHAQNADGRPYDHLLYPHIGNPGGPCDALDDPFVSDIWLQWGSRLGKTFFGQCATLMHAAVKPCPMMFASSVEKLAVEVVARTYSMIERCRPLRSQLRPPRQRHQQRIDFDACKMHVAWSRSVSTLADKDVQFGHAGEYDKWEHTSTSKEADPGKLFDDRFKNFSSFKRIKESTPSVRGRSRIEHGRLQSTDCSYYVPCPHCGGYQKLRLDRIIWDKKEGHSDADLSRNTSVYHCEFCDGRILDHHRATMMRSGVWCPAGCTVDNDAAAALFAGGRIPALSPDYEWRGWSNASWVRGEPLRNGTDAGYQLSSYYALMLSWGKIAAEFVKCKKKPQELRNFINQWAGETWESTRTKTLPEKLGEKLERDLPRRVVPEGGLYVTVGVDRQSADGGFFVFVVVAWGEDERAWLIDWGESPTSEDLLNHVLLKEYQHADGGYAVSPSVAFVDSGAETKAIYDFCKDKYGIFPCKGMNESAVEPYRIANIGMGSSKARTEAAKSAVGQMLVHVNTDYWESELQARLDDRMPGAPGSLTFVKGAGMDMDLCEQLLNGGPEDKVDARGYGRLLWVKKNEGEPNDLRDALRYSMCAAKAWLDERNGRLPVRSLGVRPPTRVVVNTGDGRPDGRPWV